MVLNLEVSNKAPALPVELTNDLMDSFGFFSAAHEGAPLGQPLAWACVAVKEADNNP